jgi:hypothetical protein
MNKLGDILKRKGKGALRNPRCAFGVLRLLLAHNVNVAETPSISTETLKAIWEDLCVLIMVRNNRVKWHYFVCAHLSGNEF